MGAVNAASAATMAARIEGGYETTDGATMELSFTDPIADAQPVKDFLEPQLRAATDKRFELAFEIDFANGLALSGDAPEDPAPGAVSAPRAADPSAPVTGARGDAIIVLSTRGRRRWHKW